MDHVRYPRPALSATATATIATTAAAHAAALSAHHTTITTDAGDAVPVAAPTARARLHAAAVLAARPTVSTASAGFSAGCGRPCEHAGAYDLVRHGCARLGSAASPRLTSTGAL